MKNMKRLFLKVMVVLSFGLVNCLDWIAVQILISCSEGCKNMIKEEYTRRYGEEAYEDYKKKQAELSRQWRQKNKEKARKYGWEYYYKLVHKYENKEGV